MPEFAGFDAGLCRTLLTQMSEFATPLSYAAPARRPSSPPGGTAAAKCWLVQSGATVHT